MEMEMKMWLSCCGPTNSQKETMVKVVVLSKRCCPAHVAAARGYKYLAVQFIEVLGAEDLGTGV